MDFDWQVSLQVLGVNVSGFEESLPDLRYCGGKCIGLVLRLTGLPSFRGRQPEESL